MKTHVRTLCLALAIVLLVLAPASAFAATSTKYFSNSNTSCRGTLNWTPNAVYGSDFVNTVSSYVSGPYVYRSAQCTIQSSFVNKYYATLPSGSVKASVQSLTFYPQKYVNATDNRCYLRFMAGTTPIQVQFGMVSWANF
jgi:Flp pilus assembly protein TadG